MSPSAPLTVHPSWVHTASIAEKEFWAVRARRNTPALDSTSTAPPTDDRADPLTLTWTPVPLNVPAALLSGVADPPSLGDVDEPPQAEKSVACVAQEAAEHVPAQN